MLLLLCTWYRPPDDDRYSLLLTHLCEGFIKCRELDGVLLLVRRDVTMPPHEAKLCTSPVTHCTQAVLIIQSCKLLRTASVRIHSLQYGFLPVRSMRLGSDSGGLNQIMPLGHNRIMSHLLLKGVHPVYRTVHIHTYTCVCVLVCSHCVIRRQLYTLSHVMWMSLVMKKLSAVSCSLPHSVCF